MISFKKLGGCGRFGNQLFQYAFLRTEAEKLGVKFYCPQWLGDEIFNLNDRTMRAEKSEQLNNFYIEPAGRCRCGRIKIEDGTEIEGHFESEKCFDGAGVRKWYSFKEEKFLRIREKYKNIDFSSCAGLHLRLGDKLKDAESRKDVYVPSLGYYLKGLRFISRHKQILIFSDEIESAKKYFGNSGLKLTYMEGNEDWEDFYLMALCRDFICAPSTLSWWAAWLNKNPDRMIIYPKEGIFRPVLFADDKNLISKNFIQIRALRPFMDSYLAIGFPFYRWEKHLRRFAGKIRLRAVFFLAQALPRGRKNNVFSQAIHLFERHPMPTEFNAYQLLSENPISGVKYLAVPWSTLINKNRLKWFLPKKASGGFTVCQHDYYKQIIPHLKRAGIKTLFTPNAGADCDSIKVLSFPHCSPRAPGPAANKDIWYSFIGYTSHPCRKEIIRLQNNAGAYIKERREWHFDRDVFGGKNTEQQQEAYQREYEEILSRSRFSLCPRGAGVSSFRFWESLSAGAIPVLISDEQRLPELKEINWDNCIIRLAENNINNVEKILSAISREKEEEMRKNCLLAHKLCSAKNFVKCIRQFYGQDNEEIKIYCYFTPSYKKLVDDFFLPSITEYKPVLMQSDYCGKAVSYKEKNWDRITAGKINFIIEAIKDSWGKIFIFSDPDVQFFGPTKADILRAMEGKDIVFQKDFPTAEACTGFFACRANELTFDFWTRAKYVARFLNTDDQKAVNLLLDNSNYGAKIGFLSERFMNGRKDYFNFRDIVLFHANWTAGIENKIKMLQKVKNEYNNHFYNSKSV